MRKNNTGIATGSNMFEKAKSNAKKKGNRAVLDGVGKIQKCVVLLKKIKIPVEKIPKIKNGTQSAMAGNIKLKRCVVKLEKFNGSQSEVVKKMALFSGSKVVPQAKIDAAFTKNCVVKIKRMNKDLVANNSSAIELPRSIVSPLSPTNDFGIELENLINKSNSTQQNTNLEPICLQDSYISTNSITPLNESVGENGHAMSTNQSITNDHQSPVHILNNAIDRGPQTPASKTEESSENNTIKSHNIADKNGRSKAYKLTTLQKQRKFFNRKNQISTKLQNSKPKNVSSKKRKLSKNVYDFLSQSHSTDQDEQADPAADIIKQMIIDGKVAVTSLYKGRLRCKPTQPRAKKVRPVGKRKQCSLIDINKNIKNKESNENPEVLMDAAPPSTPSPIMSPLYEADNIEEDIFEPDHSHTKQNTKLNNSKASGSTTNLARSVLIHENYKRKSELDINERQKLLDIARKFVSTPINKKLSNIRRNEPLNNMNLSPIVVPHRTSCKSPWRVPDDVPLPNTFVFGRNSSDLPSFSSDFLSKSPRKPTSNNQSNMKNQSATSTSSQKPRENESLLSPIDNQSIPIRDTFQQLLNNSNGENLPPKSPLGDYGSKNNSTRTGANDDYSNENDENFVHLPNPRRTIQNRSPLKKINVLEVITLPSWQNKDNKILTKEQQSTKSVDDAAKQSTTSNKQLFGFDEFLNIPLDSDDIQQQSTSKNINNSNSDRNKTLREIYQNLEDIRPREDEIPKPTKEPMRLGYDEGGTRQQDLREMFCSTMVNQNKMLTEGGISNQSQQNDDAGEETDNLFSDPETTFNNKQPHQTYGRPKKRVRKNRHEFVMLMDSDLSDEEDAHDKKQKSPKRKKHRSNKENAELKEFVKSFNEMCKDVENYELVVE